MRFSFSLISRFWRQYRGTALIALGGIAISLAGAQFERQRVGREFQRVLELRASDEAARVQRSVDAAVEILQSVAGLYESSKEVDRDEFTQFSRRALQSHREIAVLEWAPLVSRAQRRGFEAELGKFMHGRGIRELGLDGRLVSAATRDEYLPVTFLNPLAGNEGALGFDVSSRVGARLRLDRARDEAKPTVSPVVTLVQGDGSMRGILMFQPIYRAGSTVDTVSARRQHFLGFAIALLRPDELVNSALHGFSPTGLDVMLVDAEAVGPQRLLRFHPSRTRTVAIPSPSIEEMVADMQFEMPITVPGGRWLIRFRPAPAFLEEHRSWVPLGLLLAGLGITGVLTFTFARRSRYLEEILKLAQHDALTGLPNRVLFRERLDQALAHAAREQTQLAILFLDLDRFKHINDSLGHTVGDRLLQELGDRLHASVRKEDTVARTGGDEFIVLMGEFHQDQDAACMAEKLLTSIASAFEIDGRAFYLTASIGISVYPRDTDQAEALIANADAAMYRAKHKGRNQFEFYSEELTAEARERLDLEADLRQAMQEGALSVHYQPQVELGSGRVIGAEALCRWNHPKRGEVSPARFIPVAEDAGLIVALGEMVLRQACRQARLWLDAGLQLSNMAVNVSGQQIQRGGFVETVRRVLEETGLPPERLELEVTEGFLMGQAESSIATLIDLSRLGVTLSIDDFGTGYSSLAYLKRLPIHKLKIDRSFVRDLPGDEEDVAITRAIVALAQSLVLPVIAEGVETVAQRDFLLRIGCQQAQGFLYGRPVPAVEFPAGPIVVD